MITAVVNHKGGTGKTTTSINLGSALAAKKQKVLLVDLDAQGSLSYSLGIGDFDAGMSEVFEGSHAMDQVLVDREGMQVAPSNMSLAEIELAMAGTEKREQVLKDVLAGYDDQFDQIIVDCPPSLSLLTVNALTAAHSVLIPMQMEVLSLQGLDLISETIGRIKKAYNPELQVLGILPVMVDSRKKLSTEVYEHIQENYDVPVFRQKIRTNVKASEAPSFGQSVIRYAPNANSAQDYKMFANEFLKTVQPLTVHGIR
ncbi:MAG: ParA family protein [Bacteroidota bacterium]